MYQSFAPDMPYQENLPDYEEARNTYQTFTINEGHYTDDIAKTLTYIISKKIICTGSHCPPFPQMSA